MGLFSRKSPEEKRLKKFEKTEKQINKHLKFGFVMQGGALPRIDRLFMLSSNKEEYDKTNNYFKNWIDNSVYLQYDKLSRLMWFEGDSWSIFSVNCFNGFIGLMVTNQYHTCLEYINKLLEMETAIYRVKVNTQKTTGFKVSFGSKNNNPQIESFKQFKFFMAVCLYELNEKQLALEIFRQLPADYGFIFPKKTDDYFKTNFKYAEGLYAREFIELINKSNTPKTSNSPKMVNKTKDKSSNLPNANLISCPNCYEKIPENAIRCKYCKTMLGKYASDESSHSGSDDKPNLPNTKLISCPSCNKEIPANAIRCKYCKTMLKTY